MSDAGQEELLIAAALAGSARAWEQLVKSYESRVYNYGLRLTGNPSDALDLMQDVFLGVYRNLRNFRGDAKFTSWLFRIAHNKAVDMNRRQRPLSIMNFANNDGVHVASADGESAGGAQDYDSWADEATREPEVAFAQEQSNQQILQMLGALSMEQRIQIELKIFQSLTFEEIAEMQNISENTAKTRFYSALKKLKNLMEPTHVV